MPKATPRTTVIVLNWNGKDLLEECLSSLWKQTDRDFEVLLVDNGSVDGSVSFVRDHFPWVKVLALPENLGFAKGNNVGMRRVSTDRIALLNNDTRVDERWLERLNDALDAHPEVGLCASKMLNYFRPDTIDSAGDQLGVGLAFQRGTGEKDGEAYADQRYVFGACAGAALYRRELLQEVGLFDESFGTNYEDVDLSFRAQIAGWRCLYVPDAIVYHKVGETKRRSGWTFVESHKNRLASWFANAPTSVLVKYSPALLQKEATLLLYYAGVRRRRFARPDLERVSVLLRSYALFVRHLPRTLEKRRRIQERRVVTPEYIESLITVPAKPAPRSVRGKLVGTPP